MLSYFIFGSLLGLSAGVSPGPLFALVISEAINKGVPAGIRVAIAPLLTDLPIILTSLYLLYKMNQTPVILAFISITGAVYVGYLGYQGLCFRDIPSGDEKSRQSLLKGVIVNFVNPHPYLFWITVGSTTIFKAYQETPFHAITFLASFYIHLVGSKIVLAILAGRSKRLIQGRWYVTINRFLGLLLIAFSFMLIRDGWRFFKSCPQ